MLCSWAKYFTFKVPLSILEYKQVLADYQRSLMKCLGSNLGMDWWPIQGGVLIPLVASLNGNWYKLWLVGLLGLSTDCAIIIRPY